VSPNEGGDWIAWAFSPEHIVISVVGGTIALSVVIALGFALQRLWRRAGDQLDNAAEPASALSTNWWLCPICNSLNRSGQQCYKGCATTDGQVLPARNE
jgi:hypothetical protein